MYEGGDAWITKHGGAGGRLGDYLCVDCDNLPYAGGHNQFTNTQNSPDQISKSRHNTALLPSLGLFCVQSANGAYCRHKRHGVTHDAEGDNDRSSLAQTDLARSETGKVRKLKAFYPNSKIKQEVNVGLEMGPDIGFYATRGVPTGFLQVTLIMAQCEMRNHAIL